MDLVQSIEYTKTATVQTRILLSVAVANIQMCQMPHCLISDIKVTSAHSSNICMPVALS